MPANDPTDPVVQAVKRGYAAAQQHWSELAGSPQNRPVVLEQEAVTALSDTAEALYIYDHYRNDAPNTADAVAGPDLMGDSSMFDDAAAQQVVDDYFARLDKETEAFEANRPGEDGLLEIIEANSSHPWTISPEAAAEAYREDPNADQQRLSGFLDREAAAVGLITVTEAKAGAGSLQTMLQEQADGLPASDWHAHRDLAQFAVATGHAAQVEQHFSNDVSDPEQLTHRTNIYLADAPEIEGEPVESTEEGPMGDSVSTETFTPANPTGYFGERTPWEDSPVPPPSSVGPPVREAPSRDQYAETVSARSRLFGGMSTKNQSGSGQPAAEFQQRERLQTTQRTDLGRGRGD